jgi:cullin 1
MASTYQAAILTQFNETDSLSFKELHQGTMLAEGVLKPQLALLCKAKVLIQDEDQYDLNLSELSLFFSLPLRLTGRVANRTDMPDFKSKKIRVNINMPVKSEQKTETSEVLAAVDEDRKFIYQATIVRLMKARKVSLAFRHDYPA